MGFNSAFKGLNMMFSILLLTRYDQLFLSLDPFPRVILYIYYFSLDFLFHFSILNIRIFPCLGTQPFLLYDFLIRRHFCKLVQQSWIDFFFSLHSAVLHSIRHVTYLYFSVPVRFFYRPFNLDIPCLLFPSFVRILVLRLLKFSDS